MNFFISINNLRVDLMVFVWILIEGSQETHWRYRINAEPENGSLALRGWNLGG